LVASLAASKVRELVFEDTRLKVRTLKHLVGLLGVLNAKRLKEGETVAHELSSLPQLIVGIDGCGGVGRNS
jgi:hypothetical protein